MREFREPQISDKPKIDYILSHNRQTVCEFCFGNIFIWGPIFGTQISMCSKDFLVCRSTDEKPSYSIPKGHGDFSECVKALKSEAESDGHRLELYAVTQKEKEQLESLFPNKFRFIESRHNFDYVYSLETLANLSGKQFHSKRNHIKYFEKNNEWNFEEICDSNIDECKAMNEKWYKEAVAQRSDDSGIDKEYVAVNRALDYFNPLNLKGGLIRANGEVVAFTIGEKLNDDTFCTHIEKAFSSQRGAYPIINREFSKHLLKDFKYVNREEDMGLEGLRKAKLSYKPERLETKYRAVFEG